MMNIPHPHYHSVDQYIPILVSQEPPEDTMSCIQCYSFIYMKMRKCEVIYVRIVSYSHTIYGAAANIVW